MKGRFSTTDPVFDYGQRAKQYRVYRNYILQNTHLPLSSLSHGIYLILPDGVTLAQSLLDLANAQNIPIYLSGVEVDQNNPNIARVKWPEVVNFDALNRSDLFANYLPDSFFRWGMPRNLAKWNGLNFSNATLDLQQAADEFASSHLDTNNEPDSDQCPD